MKSNILVPTRVSMYTYTEPDVMYVNTLSPINKFLYTHLNVVASHLDNHKTGTLVLLSRAYTEPTQVGSIVTKETSPLSILSKNMKYEHEQDFNGISLGLTELIEIHEKKFGNRKIHDRPGKFALYKHEHLDIDDAAYFYVNLAVRNGNTVRK